MVLLFFFATWHALSSIELNVFCCQLKALMPLMDLFLCIIRLQIGVYRMSNERIGCSLADAAATPDYINYLEAASNSLPCLHVIYINTSLETKAYAHELVPTITCTSSNVVQTMLQVGSIASIISFLACL